MVKKFDVKSRVGEEANKIYDDYAKVIEEYKKFAKIFNEADFSGILLDFSKIKIRATSQFFAQGLVLGESLKYYLSEDKAGYDAIYACPEVISFLMLSPYFEGPREPNIDMRGIHKKGTFYIGEGKVIDCYQVPLRFPADIAKNDIAKNDCIIVHSTNPEYTEWRLLELQGLHNFREAYNNLKSEKVLTMPEKFKNAVGEIADFIRNKAAENKKDNFIWLTICNDFYKEFLDRYDNIKDD